MIEKSETKAAGETAKRHRALKVFGVGGAGGSAVEHMARSSFDGVTFVALNTDIRALADCMTAGTLPLGSRLTRGLGAGGDPEIGRAAAEENAEQLRELCEETDIVMIATGLGGGTGTGASPVLARIARETGALVMGVATLPFECEGTRRRQQARTGLDELKQAADAVICLSNERVLKLADENTSIVETFRLGNDLIAQAMRGIWRLLTRNGIINVDFADLCSVVRGRHTESSFAAAEAQGEHRSREVVEKLARSPLLEGGVLLGEAESILVSLVGSADLTMCEVNRVMAQINRACEDAQIVMGAAVDVKFTDRLAVTVIASRRGRSEPEAVWRSAGETTAEFGVKAAVVTEATGGATELDDQLLPTSQTERPASRFVPPPPALTPEQKEEALSQQSGGKANRKPRSKMRQGLLPLEIVSKGRFEKSEPTIYHGEDLDVPTYIRRGVPLN